MSFPHYSSYKASDIPWISSAPAHWVYKRYKQIFDERGERSADGSEELLSVSAYTGVTPRADSIDEGEYLTRAESLEGYKLCQKNDLVMNIMLAWNRGLGFAKQPGMVSPAYSVFRVVDGSNPDYLNYLLRSDEMIRYFKAFSAGVIDSRLRLYPETFGRLYVALPTPKEQAQIARFLDHETTKIDALIAEQQRLIELLKEKRQAVISHAVTKGLDPNVPMKDSGVEWLGEVPAHWTVSKLGHVASVVRGSSPRPAGDPDLFNGDYMPWVTVAEITKDEEIYLTSTEAFLTEKGSGQSRVFRQGTLLLSNSGATLGVPKILSINANANDGVVGFELLTLDIKFCFHYLSTLTQDLRERVKQGSGQPNLNTDIVRNISIAVPPDCEVIRIVAAIEELRSEYAMLVTTATEAISLLQERRSALISAAVTGKIDVRNWKPPTNESAFDPEVRQAGMETPA